MMNIMQYYYIHQYIFQTETDTEIQNVFCTNIQNTNDTNECNNNLFLKKICRHYHYMIDLIMDRRP